MFRWISERMAVSAFFFLLFMASCYADAGNTRTPFPVKPIGSVYERKGNQIHYIFYHPMPKEGEILYFINPVFQTVSFRFDGKKAAKFTVEIGNASEFQTCDFLIDKENLDNIMKNRDRYKKILDKTVSVSFSAREIQDLFSLAEKDISEGRVWKGIEELAKIMRSQTADETARSRAHYLTANAFWSWNFSNKNKMIDCVNYKTILLEMAEKYPKDNPRVRRAFFELAQCYSTVNWETKNEAYYRYLKQSGDYGEIIFDYGKNMLLTMEKDSILFTEGGDSQVFSLQTLLQIEKLRPDITVYDQRGNIFDQIYGDMRMIGGPELEAKMQEADRTIFTQKSPPPGTEIRSFADKKTAFRKRTGPVYFTWEYPRLDKINEELRLKSRPTYHLEQTGILYELVEDGKHSGNPYKGDEIRKRYQWSGNPEEWPEYPDFARDVLFTYFIQYGGYYARNGNVIQTEEMLKEAERIGYDQYIRLGDVFDNISMYFTGDNRNKFKTKAKEYYRKGAAAGYRQANDRLKELGEVSG